MSEQSHSRSARAQKAEEVRAAGSAKAGAGHPIAEEGGPAEAPTEGKGKPKPAASTADLDGTSQDGASSATAGKRRRMQPKVLGTPRSSTAVDGAKQRRTRIDRWRALMASCLAGPGRSAARCAAGIDILFHICHVTGRIQAVANRIERTWEPKDTTKRLAVPEHRRGQGLPSAIVGRGQKPQFKLAL